MTRSKYRGRKDGTDTDTAGDTRRSNRSAKTASQERPKKTEAKGKSKKDEPKEDTTEKGDKLQDTSERSVTSMEKRSTRRNTLAAKRESEQVDEAPPADTKIYSQKTPSESKKASRQKKPAAATKPPIQKKPVKRSAQRSLRNQDEDEVNEPTLGGGTRPRPIIRKRKRQDVEDSDDNVTIEQLVATARKKQRHNDDQIASSTAEVSSKPSADEPNESSPAKETVEPSGEMPDEAKPSMETPKDAAHSTTDGVDAAKKKKKSTHLVEEMNHDHHRAATSRATPDETDAADKAEPIAEQLSQDVKMNIDTDGAREGAAVDMTVVPSESSKPLVDEENTLDESAGKVAEKAKAKVDEDFEASNKSTELTTIVEQEPKDAKIAIDTSTESTQDLVRLEDARTVPVDTADESSMIQADDSIVTDLAGCSGSAAVATVSKPLDVTSSTKEEMGQAFIEVASQDAELTPNEFGKSAVDKANDITAVETSSRDPDDNRRRGGIDVVEASSRADVVAALLGLHDAAPLVIGMEITDENLAQEPANPVVKDAIESDGAAEATKSEGRTVGMLLETAQNDDVAIDDKADVPSLSENTDAGRSDEEATSAHTEPAACQTSREQDKVQASAEESSAMEIDEQKEQDEEANVSQSGGIDAVEITGEVDEDAKPIQQTEGLQAVDEPPASMMALEGGDKLAISTSTSDTLSLVKEDDVEPSNDQSAELVLSAANQEEGVLQESVRIKPLEASLPPAASETESSIHCVANEVEAGSVSADQIPCEQEVNERSLEDERNAANEVDASRNAFGNKNLPERNDQQISLDAQAAGEAEIPVDDSIGLLDARSSTLAETKPLSQDARPVSEAVSAEAKRVGPVDESVAMQIDDCHDTVHQITEATPGATFSVSEANRNAKETTVPSLPTEQEKREIVALSEKVEQEEDEPQPSIVAEELSTRGAESNELMSVEQEKSASTSLIVEPESSLSFSVALHEQQLQPLDADIFISKESEQESLQAARGENELPPQPVTNIHTSPRDNGQDLVQAEPQNSSGAKRLTKDTGAERGGDVPEGSVTIHVDECVNKNEEPTPVGDSHTTEAIPIDSKLALEKRVAEQSDRWNERHKRRKLLEPDEAADAIPTVSLSQAPAKATLHRANLAKIKVLLYSLGSRVHKSCGYEKMFRDYLNALSLRLKDNLTKRELLECQPIIEVFLRSKALRKLHNRLILGLLQRCVDPKALLSDITSDLPEKLKCRINIVPNGASGSKFGLGTAAKVLQSRKARKRVTLPSYTPALSESTPRPARPHQMPCPSVTRIPGASIIDPFLRKFSLSNGMKVSENAVWLVVVAMKEYTKSLLENTVAAMKAVDAGKLPPLPTTRPQALPKKRTAMEKDDKSVDSVDKKIHKATKCITAHDIHLVLTRMPMGARSISGCVSRTTFERSLHSCQDNAMGLYNRPLQEVREYMIKEVVSPLVKAGSAPMEPSQAEAKPTGVVNVPNSRGLGRGAKDLVALKARSSATTATSAQVQLPTGDVPTAAAAAATAAAAVDATDAAEMTTRPALAQPQHSTQSQISAPLAQEHSGDLQPAELQQTAPAAEEEAAPTTGQNAASRRGKGFGVKDLAAMRARSATAPDEPNEEAETTDAKNESTE